MKCTKCHVNEKSKRPYWQDDGRCDACHAEYLKAWRLKRGYIPLAEYRERAFVKMSDFLDKLDKNLPKEEQAKLYKKEYCRRYRLNKGHRPMEKFREQAVIDMSHFISKLDKNLTKEERRKAITLEYQRKWIKLHPEKDKRYRLRYPFKKLYLRARKIASEQNLPFFKSYEEFQKELSPVPTRCPVLGIPIFLSSDCNFDNRGSIDRIDSKKGYMPGNIAIISMRANAIKNNGTAEEHRKIADWMDQKLKSAVPIGVG